MGIDKLIEQGFLSNLSAIIIVLSTGLKFFIFFFFLTLFTKVIKVRHLLAPSIYLAVMYLAEYGLLTPNLTPNLVAVTSPEVLSNLAVEVSFGKVILEILVVVPFAILLGLPCLILSNLGFMLDSLRGSQYAEQNSLQSSISSEARETALTQITTLFVACFVFQSTFFHEFIVSIFKIISKIQNYSLSSSFFELPHLLGNFSLVLGKLYLFLLPFVLFMIALELTLGLICRHFPFFNEAQSQLLAVKQLLGSLFLFFCFNNNSLLELFKNFAAISMF